MSDENDPPCSTKVYKLEVLVIDHDGVGADGIKQVLENQRYPNRCIHPKVVGSEEREVGWTDEHPLNKREGWQPAYDELFNQASNGKYVIRWTGRYVCGPPQMNSAPELKDSEEGATRFVSRAAAWAWLERYYEDEDLNPFVVVHGIKP